MKNLILLFLLGCEPGSIELTNEYVITATRDSCASGVAIPEDAEIIKVENCWYDEEYEYHCEDTTDYEYNSRGDLVVNNIWYECVITCE